LLGALVALRHSQARWRRVPLRAVHINHGLRPAANDWAKHCRSLCRRLGVPLTVRKVSVLPARGQSLEAVARDARYAALGRGLRRGEWLLAAHHVDDQLETLLLQLLRGAGVSGLAAMPRQASFGAGWLLRPLLGESRSALERWAATHGLDWVDDDSNVDERFDRNYLRRRVLPLLRARWPAAATVAARSAAHLGEARELLEVLAATDLAAIVADGHCIDLGRLGRLGVARQRNVLRHWLRTRGLPVPDAVHLERIRSELPAARRDAQPQVRWEGGEVRRFRGLLYAFASAGSMNAVAVTPPSLQWSWRRRRRLALGEGLGALRLVADPHGELAAASLPATLWVGAREGGEKLVTAAGGPQRPLKELLRVAAVLPWDRGRLPVLFDSAPGAAARRVVAIPGIGTAVAYRALPGVTPVRGRLRLVWEGGFC
jgi:tRNA(Ile)-lysidine synthase